MSLAGDKPTSPAAAFSLVELLVVVAVIAVLAAAGLPALKGITGSTGRTGGLNALMSAVDQARSAAILSGTNSYLVFADAVSFGSLPSSPGFNPANYVYRAYAIFRDGNPDLGESGFRQVGKWENLPAGISLLSTSILNLPTNQLSISLTGNTTTVYLSLRSIVFNGSRGLVQASAINGVTVYEGTWDGNVDRPARTNRLVDKITLHRFTGRAFLSTGTHTWAN